MGTPAAQDFSAVYVRWMPSLTRYCRTILRSDADAEDAAQNAMLKAMDALATGPAPDQLTPWLHRIARNEAISLMRRRRGDAELLELHHEEGPAPDEVVGTRDRLAQLVADVQALPERQRQALVLRELDGLPYREIASVLCVSEAAAQQAVLDARRSMTECETGRALECESVQGWLNAHEHALVRGRKVRAHLRDCSGCRAFATDLGTRPRELALLLPVGSSGMGLLARVASLFAGGGAVAGKVVLGAGLLTAGIGLGEMVVQPSAPGASAEAPAVRQAPRAHAATAATGLQGGVRVTVPPSASALSRSGASGRTTAPARGTPRATAGSLLPGRTTSGGVWASSVAAKTQAASSHPQSAPASSPSRTGGRAPTSPSSASGSTAGKPAAARDTTPSSPVAAATEGTPAAPVVSHPAVAPVVTAVAPVVEQVTKAADPIVKTVTDTVGATTSAAQGTTTTVTQTVTGVTGKLLGG